MSWRLSDAALLRTCVWSGRKHAASACSASHNGNAASDAVSPYTQVKVEDEVRVSGQMDTSTTSQMTKTGQSVEEPVPLLERNLCGHSTAGLLLDRHVERFYVNTGERKQQFGMVVCASSAGNPSLRVRG